MFSLGAPLSLFHFDAQTRPINEMKSMELLTAELLQKLLKHKGGSLSKHSSLLDVSGYLSPFQNIVNIAPISYRIGNGHVQMTPGNLFYRFEDFLPAETLKKQTLKHILRTLEVCDFCGK